MFQILARVWALLVGIVLIMLGNGMHFTLIGLRGGIRAFSAAGLAIVTSGCSAGFLSGRLGDAGLGPFAFWLVPG